MTKQLPDSCTFAGRTWVIEYWDGPECVPTNEQLGLKTVMRSFNNHRGRIDHFIVHRRHLHLLKIEITLNPKRRPRPQYGCRREINYRFVPIEVCRSDGTRVEVRKERSDFYVFDDLVVPFCGRLRLSYPYFDFWNLPWPLSEADEEPTDETTLTFDDGLLVE